MARILLVDDEPSILSVLGTLLKAEGYNVTTALGGEKAVPLLKSEEFDLLLTDIRMNPINGMQLLQMVHDEFPGMAVLMLTAYGSVETAIEALKLGAFDYVTKPFKVDELLITVQRALEYNKVMSENVDLRSQLSTTKRFDSIIAESTAMKLVCDMVERVAPTDTTVLITGDSGTGKEVVAKAIHALSRRNTQPFIAVNCAALPEPLLESEMFGHVKGAFTGANANKDGLFEAANNGTIFLDEIGAMPLSIQGKLLRVLQEKEIRKVGGNDTTKVDVRVIAATNIPLERLIEEGTFREDLFYRLSVIPIEIKPLKDRQEDILPLVYHILQKESTSETPPSIAPEVCTILEQYDWPGNVRELENAIKHCLAFANDGKISKEALPEKILKEVAHGSKSGKGANQQGANSYKGKSLKAFLRSKEKEYVDQVLSATDGNKEDAAKALKISLATLYRKLPESND
jgi:DNA-binding NtrC family response regulator